MLKKDIKLAVGPLQTCAGHKSGTEAAIHALADIFRDDECEGILLVDAENAFNTVNRKMALEAVGRRCPLLLKYLKNSYKKPARLHLSDGTHILSCEGVTQGDNLAMAMYALSTREMIHSLKENASAAKQVWLADDSGAGGKIVDLKAWWDHLNDVGPAMGYFPKGSKTFLILKDAEKLSVAQEIFGESVKITCSGYRHLGACIGSQDFKDTYVSQKVQKWVEDVNQIAKIAKEEPQAAICAYNRGISQR